MPSKPNPKASTTSEETKKNRSLVGFVKENLPTVVMAVLLAVGVRTFIAEPRYIPTTSMEPTLLVDDRLIIDKISLLWRKPERGEIIVFYPPDGEGVPDSSKAYIKRLIGLPGDRIAIKDGKVYVNGIPLQEDYIAEPPNYSIPNSKPLICPPNCVFQPANTTRINNVESFIVPENHYWVMGDNRNNSADSHIWGFLPADRLLGRAWLRFWPPHRIGIFDQPRY
ncbi:MAG: signal peptidase I [Pseudanabaenaceae cyanobacterium]